MTFWGVVVVASQQHKQAAKEMRQEEVRYFLPRYERLTSSCGHLWRKRVPLFGRYVFFVVDHAWERVCEIRSIAAVVLNRETLKPQRANSRQVEALRKLCDENGIINLEDVKFSVGDKVESKFGSFRGLVGEYDGEVDAKHDAVIYNILGQETRVVLRRGSLERVS